MEQQDTLAEILRVEKELREQLDDERARAAAWLAETHREAEAAHERELEALEATGATGGSASASRRFPCRSPWWKRSGGPHPRRTTCRCAACARCARK